MRNLHKQNIHPTHTQTLVIKHAGRFAGVTFSSAYLRVFYRGSRSETVRVKRTIRTRTKAGPVCSKIPEINFYFVVYLGRTVASGSCITEREKVFLKSPKIDRRVYQVLLEGSRHLSSSSGRSFFEEVALKNFEKVLPNFFENRLRAYQPKRAAS